MWWVASAPFLNTAAHKAGLADGGAERTLLTISAAEAHTSAERDDVE